MPTAKYLFSILAFCLFFAFSANAQKHSGNVTEIIDGKTVIITTDSGNKTTLQLLYIEVPEPEQQLYQIVKSHLEKLVLNKSVQYISQSEYSQGILGRLYLGEVDIAQQLLRDGAAWFNSPEYGLASIRIEYQEMENLAKAEKRGVWGVKDLKPAWEFRDEQYAKMIAAKKAEVKLPTNQTEIMWADIPVSKENIAQSENSPFNPDGPITFEYDEFTDEGAAFSPTIVLTGRIFNVQYRYLGKNPKKGGNKFIIATNNVSYDDELIFLTQKGERFNLGTSKSTGSKSVVYFYYIDRSSLVKIVNSDVVYVKIGVSKSAIDPRFLNSIKRLLIATQ